MRGPCVTAQRLFERQRRAVADVFEDARSFLRPEREDTRRGDLESHYAVVGWFDERAAGTHLRDVVDAVVRVEVLTGRDLYPGADGLGPSADALGPYSCAHTTC